MPIEQEHIELALHNMEVIEYLLAKPKFCDWTATVSFYTALHIVEAVFFHDTKHIQRRHGNNHEERDNMLKRTASYKNIWKHYRPLESVSIVARYLQGLGEKGLTFQQYISSEQVKEKLVKHRLSQVIKTASKFLSSNSGNLLKNAFDKTLKIATQR